LRRYHGFSIVNRLKLGKLLGVFLNQIGQLPKHPAALRGCYRAPWPFVKRLARCLDGSLDIFPVTFGNVG
jgi:hypothetical protein